MDTQLAYSEDGSSGEFAPVSCEVLCFIAVERDKELQNVWAALLLCHAEGSLYIGVQGPNGEKFAAVFCYPQSELCIDHLVRGDLEAEESERCCVVLKLSDWEVLCWIIMLPLKWNEADQPWCDFNLHKLKILV